MIIRKCPHGEFPPENSRPIKLLPGKVPPEKLLPTKFSPGLFPSFH